MNCKDVVVMYGSIFEINKIICEVLNNYIKSHTSNSNTVNLKINTLGAPCLDRRRPTIVLLQYNRWLCYTY